MKVFRTILILLALLGSTTSDAWARQYRLKVATVAPKGTKYYQALMQMGQEWRTAPGGGVDLTVYPGGMMGGESDMVRRMRGNQIQVALMTASGLAEIDDSITALQNMPMLFKTFDEVEHVRGKLRSLIEKKFEEKGFVILSLEDTGWVRFFANKPAASLTEFRQLKLFALSSDSKAIQIWKSAGFNPVPLDLTTMVTGLKTGMIDAVPSTPYYALTTQVCTSASHMLDIKWAPLVGGIVIKKDVWDTLPATSHEYLRKSALKAGIDVRKAGRAKNVESIETMKKRGLKIVKLTDAQRKEWEDAAKKAYPVIRGKIVPADLFDQVIKILAEFRAKASDK